jgi:hypothetical protein
MTDGSKGRGQAKCNPWSSRLGVGRGANNTTQQKSIVTNPLEEARNHIELLRQ